MRVINNEYSRAGNVPTICFLEQQRVGGAPGEKWVVGPGRVPAQVKGTERRLKAGRSGWHCYISLSGACKLTTCGVEGELLSRA